MAGEDPLPELVRDTELSTSFHSNNGVTMHYKRWDRKKREYWYRNQQPIGIGGYGRVWLEQEIDNKGQRKEARFRAVKEISCSSTERALKEYVRELEAIAKFSQEKYADYFVRSLGWYQSPNSLYIAMEYCPCGDLKNHLALHGAVSETDTQSIISQVLRGLAHMHEEKFAHRDLKPANVLIVSRPPDEWIVKLSDFGLTKRAIAAESTTVKGTFAYLPPELLHEDARKSDHFAGDIWCIGETAYELITATTVFPHLSARWKYTQDSNAFPSEELKKAGAGQVALDFITTAMAPSPPDRPSAANALSHPWLSNLDPSDDSPHIPNVSVNWPQLAPSNEINDATSEWTTDNIPITVDHRTEQWSELLLPAFDAMMTSPGGSGSPSNVLETGKQLVSIPSLSVRSPHSNHLTHQLNGHEHLLIRRPFPSLITEPYADSSASSLPNVADQDQHTISQDTSKLDPTHDAALPQMSSESSEGLATQSLQRSAVSQNEISSAQTVAEREDVHLDEEPEQSIRSTSSTVTRPQSPEPPQTEPSLSTPTDPASQQDIVPAAAGARKENNGIAVPLPSRIPTKPEHISADTWFTMVHYAESRYLEYNTSGKLPYLDEFNLNFRLPSYWYASESFRLFRYMLDEPPFEGLRSDSLNIQTYYEACSALLQTLIERRQDDPTYADQGGYCAWVRFDREKQDEDEIDLVRDQYIVDIDKVDKAWWLGTNHKGERGLFLQNHVRIVTDNKLIASLTIMPNLASIYISSQGTTATAHFSRVAKEDDEIGFPVYAQITGLVCSHQHWWLGTYKGKRGLFPASFVRLNAPHPSQYEESINAPSSASADSPEPQPVSSLDGDMTTMQVPEGKMAIIFEQWNQRPSSRKRPDFPRIIRLVDIGHGAPDAAVALGRCPEEPETSVFSSHVGFQSKVVSRLHAKIMLSLDGMRWLQDVGSSSGTFLNSIRVKGLVRVKDGDFIQLGTDSSVELDDPTYGAVSMRVHFAAAGARIAVTPIHGPIHTTPEQLGSGSRYEEKADAARYRRDIDIEHKFKVSNNSKTLKGNGDTYVAPNSPLEKAGGLRELGTRWKSRVLGRP